MLFITERRNNGQQCIKEGGRGGGGGGGGGNDKKATVAMSLVSLEHVTFTDHEVECLIIEYVPVRSYRLCLHEYST